MMTLSYLQCIEQHIQLIFKSSEDKRDDKPRKMILNGGSNSFRQTSLEINFLKRKLPII